MVTLKTGITHNLLVYPSVKKVILSAIIVKEKDKERFLRYFVLLLQKNKKYKIYEWIYLNPADFTNTNSYPNVYTQLNTLTVWNYTFDTLDDQNFWNDYVLIKSGKKYKYLKEVK